MAGIQLLTASVAERIAAGEVIDRPAAVVKELLENAIDAGASEVRVEARGGGLRLIRVADDGHGIPAGEIELAFQRHATSKLREVEDLERLATFGFRGEALASIAAVAEVSLVSAVEGEAAVRCAYRAGRPLERMAAARSRGTTVMVSDLFSTLPARLKFMRGARAEAAQIGAVVRRMALVRPDLRLQLVLEGHVSFRAEALRGGTADATREAFAAVYGEEAAEALVPVGPAEAAGARLRGYLTSRGVTRANRSQISLFINGRYVRPHVLLSAIEAGYARLIPHGRHPLGALFLDVPPADLDVNIHPAKLDVRMRNETSVSAALTEAVRAALSQNATVVAGSPSLLLSGRQQRLARLPRRVAEETPSWGWPEGTDAGANTPVGQALPALRLVGQLHNALIVGEAAEGFYLIDQHRAHERIIYERLLASADAQRQALIEPAIVRLSHPDAERLAARLPSLEALGFDCAEFGPDQFVLRGLPADAELTAITGALSELLHEAAAGRDDWHERLLASLACRAAVRKGRPLGLPEARDLIARLGTTKAPALCPHGSPILLYLPEPYLGRQFDWG